METQKRLGVGTVVLTIVLVLVTMWLVNRAFALISSPSDLGVIGGLAILLATGIGCYLYVTKVLRPRLSHQSSEINVRSGIIVLVIALSATVNSGCTRIDPGHVGIQVDLYGKDRGVQSYPLVTGMVWYNPVSTTVFQYPTFVQTAVWTKSTTEGKPINEEITFTTGDQMRVEADISLAYHLLSEKVPAFYVKFRSDDLNIFTHGFLRNLAREKFDNSGGRYKIEQIMGDNAPFLKEVRDTLQKELEPIGVELDQFGFIGAPRPPQQVIDQINEKVGAVQSAIKVENQVREARAQAEKVVAKAEGDAKANQILTNSITQTLLEWQRLQLQGEAIKKWNGQLPQVNGSSTVPFIQVQPKP